MAGAVVQDTKLGRETVRNSFIWAMGKLDELPPGKRFTMTLEKTGDAIVFRYYPESKP